VRPPVVHALRFALFASALTFTGLCVALPLTKRGAVAPEWVVHGVALGMTEREVQAYFADGPRGAWSAVPGCSGPGLEWFRKDARSPARWARFEFRDDVLVYMKLRTGHEPKAPAAEATATAARKQHDGAAGAEIAMIDRRCVAHRAEAEQIAWVAAGGARR